MIIFVYYEIVRYFIIYGLFGVVEINAVAISQQSLLCA